MNLSHGPFRRILPLSGHAIVKGRCRETVRKCPAMIKKGAVESKHHDLEHSLQLAVREPKHIHTKDGGALLVLSVHCKPSQPSRKPP